MASSLHPNPTHFLTPKFPKPITTYGYVPIRCGPRDNRGPLVKGRILSIEAIQAIQSLKRAQKSDPENLHNTFSKTLTRLLKSDLIATLKELLRQDQCTLALHVFSAVRSEYKPDLGLYADLVSALAKNGMVDDIDRLICDLEKKGEIQFDDKGLVRLIKAVIAADRRESTVRIYGLIKKSGAGSGFMVDEYVVKVLGRGLRRLGEVDLADGIDMEFGKVSKIYLGKQEVTVV